jgi:hypothetical protein
VIQTKRTPPKRRHLQQYYRAEDLSLTDCPECEGTGAVEVVEHGDQARTERCRGCDGHGTFEVDFEDQMGYADEWSWHGSNDIKGSGSVRAELSEW